MYVSLWRLWGYCAILCVYFHFLCCVHHMPKSYVDLFHFVSTSHSVPENRFVFWVKCINAFIQFSLFALSEIPVIQILGLEGEWCVFLIFFSSLLFIHFCNFWDNSSDLSSTYSPYVLIYKKIILWIFVFMAFSSDCSVFLSLRTIIRIVCMCIFLLFLYLLFSPKPPPFFGLSSVFNTWVLLKF